MGLYLFLSPHLDDAALSCGGYIHALAQRGDPVAVHTVTAGDPTPPLPDTPIVRSLHARWQAGEHPINTRRQEDIASLQVLGAGAIHTPHLDCVYRTHDGRALYPTESSIFESLHPDDPLPAALEGEIPALMARFPGMQAIIAPLGVGHHVDHQITRDWALSIKRHAPQLALRFYEEYPYTRDANAIQRALELLTGIHLKGEIQTLSTADVEAKIQAIACHRSQISTFWEDEASMRQDVLSAFRQADGTYAERYWKCGQL